MPIVLIILQTLQLHMVYYTGRHASVSLENWELKLAKVEMTGHCTIAVWEATDTPVLDDISSWFQSQSRHPFLHLAEADKVSFTFP